MKTAIIFVLLLALGAAAYYTRPTEATFTQYITQQTTQGDKNAITAGWDQFQAAQFAKNCDFKDRLLWVDVQKDGQTVYTGAFSHWFSRAKVVAGMKNAKQQMGGVQIETR